MGPLTLREGWGLRKPVGRAHLEELTFPPLPACARHEQWFSMHGGILCVRLACFSLEEE